MASKQDILISNFLGGLAWGVGSVIGATVLIGLIGWVLKALGVFNSIVNLLHQLPQTSQLYK